MRGALVVPGLVVALLVGSAPAAVAGGVPASPASPTAPAPCPSSTRTGLYQLPGMSRPVWAYVPRGATGPQRRPAVVLLHGSGQNGPDMVDARYGTGLQLTADKYRFVIVLPSGGSASPPDQDPGPDYVWDIPGFAGGGDGDVDFLSRTIGELPRRLCVDASRISMSGFSGGARMTSQFACRHREQLVGIAPVSGLRAGAPQETDGGGYAPGPCASTGPGLPPLPVLAFHGDADPVNPYDGDPPGAGSTRWGYGVPAAVARWASVNRCRQPASDQPPAVHRPAGAPAVQVLHHSGCAGGVTVQMLRIEGGAHIWPIARGLSADELIWQQLAQSPAR